MLAVVVSRADSASVHVGEHLIELADWTEHADGSRSDGEGGGTVYRTEGVELREFDALHTEIDDAAAAFGRVDDGPDREPDLLAFASRHAGDTGPLLTAHHTGNFGPAEFGGEDRALARAAPNAHRRVFDAFREHAPEGYEVGTECTHHGPTEVGVPSLFVELGSGEDQWDDPEGARAVAKAILSLRGVDADAPDENGTRRHLVGFGGGHYAPRIDRILRETDWAVGHVAADWMLDEMDEVAESRDVLRRAFEASAADYAVVDGTKPDLKAAIAGLGYEVVSETWVRETTGVPLSLAGALEDALRPVDEGLRFGERAQRSDAADDPAFEVVDLPDDLLAEAQGIDRESVRTAVAERTLAFETAESGTLVEGRAAVDAAAVLDALVDDLVGLLDGSYDAVERDSDRVRVRETTFDPERARTLGVPDGPKFGKLASGTAVTVDGREIDPEAVHVEREREFTLGDLA